MKTRHLIALLILALSFSIYSCSDDEDDDATTPTTNNPPSNGAQNLAIESTPSAKAADDDQSSGVYKGNFVGSSGFFKIVIESSEIVCYVNVDGVEHTLTTNDLDTSNLGGVITNAVFSNAANTITLTFSVDADGGNPSATLVIQGHSSIRLSINKELSNKQIKVYVGKQYWSNQDPGDPNDPDPNRQNDWAYQCFTDMSLSLTSNSTDSTLVHAKVNGFRQLLGSYNNCGNDAASRMYGYEFLPNGRIKIETWVAECDTCPRFKESLQGESSDPGFITDRYIYFEDVPYNRVGLTFQDSTRLWRRL